MGTNNHRRQILRHCRTSLLLLPLTLILLSGCGPDEQNSSGPQGPPPMPVTVISVEPADVEVEVEYAGRVHGSREVEVRARVAGILEKRLHVEGRPVEEGDPLFRIDPESFAIAKQRANAERAGAVADLDQALREWRRIENLYGDNAISQRERDQALANRDLAQSRLDLAEAALADAHRNLRYTEVTAPIGGITGLESFPEGSLIEPGTLLTTITRHDPVHVRFSLPENDAALQRLTRQALTPNNENQGLEATIRLVGVGDYQYPGQVDFTDRVIDPRTGTVIARAVFANPDGELVPGQLVRVRMLLQKLEGVFLIPPSALGNDRNGERVFIVAADNTVQARPVIVGPAVAGGQVILSGLEPGDQLVINGQVALGHGMSVFPSQAGGEE